MVHLLENRVNCWCLVHCDHTHSCQWPYFRFYDSVGFAFLTACCVSGRSEKMSPLCLFRNRLQLVLVLLVCVCGLLFYLHAVPCIIPTCNDPLDTNTVSLSDEPFIFIGGYPRSGKFTLLLLQFTRLVSLPLFKHSKLMWFGILYNPQVGILDANVVYLLPLKANKMFCSLLLSVTDNYYF